MSPLNPGRLVLTFTLLFFGFGGIAIDGNATHLFNPTWPPHARYHLVMQFVSFAALGAVGLWLLWRPGREGLAHLNIAALIPVAMIGSFYVAALVPTTSALYESDMDVPSVLGVAVPPNVLVGTILLLCEPFAYRSARRALLGGSTSIRAEKVTCESRVRRGEPERKERTWRP